MYMSNPYNIFQNQPQNQQLVRVNGLDGARAYQMGANSSVALFDNNNDLMFIKQTDGAGFPTIRTFKFEEINPTVSKIEQVDYVTRKDMEDYVKQFISKSTLNAEPTAEVQPTTDK